MHVVCQEEMSGAEEKSHAKKTEEWRAVTKTNKKGKKTPEVHVAIIECWSGLETEGSWCLMLFLSPFSPEIMISLEQN